MALRSSRRAGILRVAVGLDDRFGCQRDDFLVVGMDQNRAQHLMGISDGAIAMVFLEARGALDGGRGEIAGAIECYQVLAVQVDEVFQSFAALQAAEDVEVHGPQACRIDGVQNSAHLRVARDVLDAINGAEVVVGVVAAFIESQQRRILQGEHGKRRHQCIAHGNDWIARTGIGDFVKASVKPLEQSIGGEILPRLLGWDTHSWQLRLPDRQDGRTG